MSQAAPHKLTIPATRSMVGYVAHDELKLEIILDYVRREAN